MEKIVWPGGAVRMSNGQMMTSQMVLEYFQVLENDIKGKRVDIAVEKLPSDIHLREIQRIAGRLNLAKRRGLGEERFPNGPAYKIVNFI